MERKPRLFGTAGIRGLTNVEITPGLALSIARSYGDWLGNAGLGAVGRDTRYGAAMLSMAAASGLVSAGMDVVDCGVIPTGGLAAYLRHAKAKGAVLITGSHTPPERIGVIAMLSDGAYVPDATAVEIEDRHAQGSFAYVPPERIGSVRIAHDALEVYRAFLLSYADVEPIRRWRPRVLVDPANGTASHVLPGLLRELGCDVVELNCVPGPVPARPSEPRAKTLSEAGAKVREHHCDLGIAPDVDADRVLFIDAGGTCASEDVIGAAFAEEVLSRAKNKLCVSPINSSGLLDWVCARIGARIEWCPPGQPSTVEKVKQVGAVYSYEESGKYYFCEEALWCDGPLAALKLLSILGREKVGLAQLVARYPSFTQVKLVVPCPDAIKARVMERLRERWENELADGRREDVTIDGLKRVYQDNSWLLLRKSGTEPLVRVYSDAMDAGRAKALVEAGKALLESVMREVEGRS
jgi:phosphomannomutase/phosphoglucomutase